ncbi:GDSL-type esterase/lipase family protein [Chitinophaga sp. MM2321]|uniref:GDSL-type esterase/lipase family protein n=1 Tax=Chitinophaga sp. MM2321 TaxID=3137178 RepID=UPI0032D56C40
MPGKNKSAYPFIIILGSLVCLLGLSQLNYTFSYKDFQFRRLDMLSDLRTTPAPDKKELTAVTDSSKLSPSDTAALAAGDSTNISNPDLLHDFMTYKGILNYTSAIPGDTEEMGIKKFMTALKELKAGKRKKVRIAYFGDSMIEGDLITSDLRDSLQTFFGGAGVGFVPVTSIVASYRTTITHTFSNNWKDYHYKNSPPSNITLGFSGHTFYSGSDSWVKYSPVRKPRLDKFQEVSLLYGAASDATVRINDKAYTLSGTAPVNKLDLRQDTGSPSLVIRYDGNPATPFYGVCFESDNGIYVDNFSFRGISGVELGRLSADMIRRMQQEHPYDLVVLHYGANVLFRPELTDYSWYERPMKKVMDSLRHDLPATSFLIIGTADKSYRKSDRYVTAPGVEALLKVQHELAEEHGTAYWNLYAAMGGEGSMVKWVEGDTVMANKDYTHFNRQGAARVGALLYKAIMNDYREAEQP